MTMTEFAELTRNRDFQPAFREMAETCIDRTNRLVDILLDNALANLNQQGRASWIRLAKDLLIVEPSKTKTAPPTDV